MREHTARRTPWVEAESVPVGQVPTFFRKPPELIEPWFPRSAIVSGALGAGKTMLLRYLAETEPPVVVQVNLLEELTGVADYQVPIDTGRETSRYARLAEAKAISLLALTIAASVSEHLERMPRSFEDCVPSAFRAESAYRDGRRMASQASLDEFGSIPVDQDPLRAFVAESAGVLQRMGHQLLILFDRAELVRPRLLGPVIRLLEKSPGYRAIVAMRPGTLDDTYLLETGRSTSGDDFDAVHLGRSPRSDTWLGFANDVIADQLATFGTPLPDDVLQFIQSITRESLRYAILLSSVYASGSDPEPSARMEQLTRAVNVHQRRLLQYVTGNLQGYHKDFRGLVADLRRQVSRSTSNGMSGPLVVSLLYSVRDTGRRSEASRLDRFINHGLRHSAFLVPEDEDWLPQSRLLAIEIPPLFLWKQGTSWWSYSRYRNVQIALAERDLFKLGGRPSGESRIFLAFEFARQDSSGFKDELERTFQASTDEGQLILSTGQDLPDGPRWGGAVVERIKRAHVLIADISGYGREIYFEAGVAYGSGRRFMFVLAQRHMLERAPEWLRPANIGFYSDAEGFAHIVASARELADQRSTPFWPRLSTPEPDRVVWVGTQGNADEDTSRRQVEALAAQANLKWSEFDVPQDIGDLDDVLEAVGRAAVVIASFDGTMNDTFQNFILGLVVARPTMARGALKRAAIAVSTDLGAAQQNWVSQSARQSQVCKVDQPTAVSARLRAYVRKVREAR